MYPIQTFPPYFPEIYSNITFPSMLMSSERSIPFRFSDPLSITQTLFQSYCDYLLRNTTKAIYFTETSLKTELGVPWLVLHGKIPELVFEEFLRIHGNISRSSIVKINVFYSVFFYIPFNLFSAIKNVKKSFGICRSSQQGLLLCLVHTAHESDGHTPNGLGRSKYFTPASSIANQFPMPRSRKVFATSREGGC
jgi:hypothetical protein